MSSRRFGLLALCITAVLTLVLPGCGGDDGTAADDEDRSVEGGTGSPEEGTDEGEAEGHDEPEYDGLPADLTPDEVCDLLDEATISEHLEAEVTNVTPGTRQPDCQWMYQLEDGPATNLQVQVMSMEQTEDRVGSEALEWALDRAPGDVDIVEVPTLEVPSASYEFGVSTVYFAVDPVGRLFSVSVHSDSPEAGRLALVDKVLDALSASHS